MSDAGGKPLVLHIITQAEFGGAQKYVFDVATGLSDRYRTIIASGQISISKELLVRAAHAGIETVELKHVVRSISPLYDPIGYREIVKLIERIRPDIIHLHASKMSVLGSMAAAKITRRYKKKGGYRPKVVYTAHGWVFTEKISTLKRWFYIWAEKFMSRMKDAIIVLSRVDKDLAYEHGIMPKKKIYIINNGVDIPESDFLSKSEARHVLHRKLHRMQPPKPLDKKNFWIGTIANLYPNKGLSNLIEAVGIVNNQIDDTQYDAHVQSVIIGDGMLRGELTEDISSRDLQDFVFLAGAVPDAYKYLRAFDLFVLPSLKEGIPFVLLEAMSAGVPIVASSVGAIPEILEDRKTAILVEPGNATQLAEHIHELMHHETLSSELAKAAHEHVTKKLTASKMIEAVDRVYQDLL